MAENGEQERAGISRRTLLAGAAVGGAGIAAVLAEPGVAAATSTFGGGEQRPLAQEPPPRTVFQVALEVGGRPFGTFAEVQGLSSETEVLEFRDGRDPNQTRKVPGNTKYSNIELKRGLTSDMALALWRKQVEDGQINEARKNGSIVLYDQTHREFARWNFVNGWPAKIEIGPFAGGEALMERITLAVEDIERV